MSIAPKRYRPGVWSPRQQHESAFVSTEQPQNRCLLLPDERSDPKKRAHERTLSPSPTFASPAGDFYLSKVQNMRHYRVIHLLHSNEYISSVKINEGLWVDPQGCRKFSSGYKDTHPPRYRSRAIVYFLRLSPCLGRTRIRFILHAYGCQT